MDKTTLDRNKKQFFSPILFMVSHYNTQGVLSSAASYSDTVGFSNQLTEQNKYTHFSQQLYKYDLGFHTNLRSLFLIK